MHTPVDATHNGTAHVVAALCDLLDTGDEADRCYACRALGVIGATEAIPALTERLRDEDIDVCVDAAGALGALGSQTAFAPLNESLRNDPDGEVKTAVLASLARSADPRTFPILMEIAEHRPPDIAFDEAEDWDPWWDMQREAVLALGRARVSEAAPMLTRLLDDEDGQDIAAEIMAVLAQLGEAGERSLIERAGHRREQFRRRAVTALGRGGSPAGLEVLSVALKDDAPSVRIAALEALDKRGNRRHLPAILGLFRDPDAGVRRAAVDAGTRLAGIAGESEPDLAALVPLLADQDPRVRAAALLGMDREHLDATSVARVYKALRDPVPDVAAIACTLIGRHGTGEQFQAVLSIAEGTAADPETRRAALRALGTRGTWDEPTAALIANVLSQSKSPVRLAALDALLALHRAGVAGEPRAAHDATQTPGPLDLIVAALAGDLVAPAEPEAAPESSSADESVNLAALEATDDVRPAKSSLEAIAIDNAEIALALAESEDTGDATEPVVDAETAEYLAITEANEATAQWLFTRNALETDLDVRRLAARILGSAAGEPAVSALLTALACNDAILRCEVAASLAALAERYPHSQALAAGLDVLLDAVVSEDRDVRIACLHALATLPDSRAGEAIVAALDDEEPAVRVAAVHSLAGVAKAVSESTPGDHTALTPRLVRAREKLADPEPGVRIAAARALTAMLSCGDTDTAELPAAVDALIHAAFAGSGTQAREMGSALRHIATASATEQLLAALRRLDTSAERRVAIELLEEIHRRDHEPIEH